MEAWKFTDYASLDTLPALNLTTARWGLAPFPHNLDVKRLGAVAIGPGNANIVSVVHGVSLIITLGTMTGLFVWLERLTRNRKSRPAASLNADHLKDKYNPPFHLQNGTPPAPAHSAGYPPQTSTAPDKAKRITACSDLLRQRYDTQFQIWGCSDNEVKNELQLKLDAMNQELWTTILRWKTVERASWTEEEMVQIEAIWSTLYQNNQIMWRN